MVKTLKWYTQLLKQSHIFVFPLVASEMSYSGKPFLMNDNRKLLYKTLDYKISTDRGLSPLKGSLLQLYCKDNLLKSE